MPSQREEGSPMKKYQNYKLSTQEMIYRRQIAMQTPKRSPVKTFILKWKLRVVRRKINAQRGDSKVYKH